LSESIFVITANFVVRHLDFVVAYDIFVKRFITTMIKKKCRRKNPICRRQNCRNFLVTTFIIICRRHKKNVVGFWMKFGEAGVFGLHGFRRYLPFHGPPTSHGAEVLTGPPHERVASTEPNPNGRTNQATCCPDARLGFHGNS
jgi:hypothetical protein